MYNGPPELSIDNRMNVSSESRKEATDKKVGALNTNARPGLDSGMCEPCTKQVNSLK